MRFPLAATALLCLSHAPAAEPKLELKPGDRIAILGNALADRMQHDGWLETLLAARFPDHDLSIRNLGVCGDELTTRLRSANFGTPDDWLRRVRADVVFGFFGYNESFGDSAKFEKNLADFIDATTNATYGKAKARLVLFSPIAHEPRNDPNWPPADANNARLERTTDAMAKVAKAKGVVFVDLFRPTRERYAAAQGPLTINGIHLTPDGNRAAAEIIDRALFGAPRGRNHDAIRAAVVDKNYHWWNRYRVVDGFNVYGDRSNLAYNGQTNRVVMDREMLVLDVMTANRDKVVWAAARGQSLKPDDSNTPPFLETVTNKPGPMPGGKHVFLEGHEAIAKMTAAPGLKVNLFADERRFPELINPVQMNFDNKGRLWVATWQTYPHWKPKETVFDKLVALEDADGDGVADKSTVFADNLHCPTGFEFWNGGVLVACQPELLFLKDTDGDGKADFRQVVLQGIDSADTHHAANSFVYDGGMALYFQEGTFHHTQIEHPYGPPVRCKNAGVFRFEPRTAKVDLYVSHGFANPHGHVFDRWGQDVVIDGTGSQPYHAALFSGQTVDENHKHPSPPQVYRQRTRPCPGAEILSSRHFPESMQGNLLVGNVIGFQGILQYKFHDKGASFGATEVEPIVYSSDPNFRPSDLKVGPDGAIYFTDWHNPIIGHMQHHIRDPNRDRDHGRVYRITCEGRPLLKPAKVDGAPVPELLNLLKEPEDRVRYAARRELAGRDSNEVVRAAFAWASGIESADESAAHHLLEALWLHQSHNVVNEVLLKVVLRSPDFRARAAATRVLCYWRDRVSEPLELLRLQINDRHPRVRLEAIRALSFFGDDRALGVAAELLAHPTDEFLTYTFNETLATLEQRINAGAKSSRRNVAAALMKILDRTKLDVPRQVALLDTVCKYGDPPELHAVWRKASDARGYPPAVRAKALEGLTDAAVNRKVKPPAQAGEVQALVRDVPPELLPAALRLAVAWKVRDAAGELARVAADATAAPAARFAAMDGLAAFAGRDNDAALLALANDARPTAVRFHAAAALAATDLPAAASAAATALAASAEGDDVGPLVRAFLARRGGPDALARAIDARRLSADAAKRVLRAMYLAGRNDAALANAASKLAGLDADPKPPTPAEVRTLIAEVAAKGDAARGEAVFRRADLGCVKCHAVNKAGGSVGPDLGPLGASSPVEYVVASILDPNAAIKEEYLTKVIATKSGKLVTGVVARRDKDVVALKDATGAVVRIPTNDIDSEEAGKSLMPEGITRILTRGELLDLMRFISELGKGAYAPPKTPTVQRWRRLTKIGPALVEGVPNRELVRDAVLAAPADAWETVFARVDGTLPLGELPAGVTYLQGEINVTTPGDVTLRVSSTSGVTVWVDEAPLDSATGRVRLEAGRHKVTVRVAASKAATLKLEVGIPTGSASRVEVVAGGE